MFFDERKIKRKIGVTFPFFFSAYRVSYSPYHPRLGFQRVHSCVWRKYLALLRAPYQPLCCTLPSSHALLTAECGIWSTGTTLSMGVDGAKDAVFGTALCFCFMFLLWSQGYFGLPNVSSWEGFWLYGAMGSWLWFLGMACFTVVVGSGFVSFLQLFNPPR